MRRADYLEVLRPRSTKYIRFFATIRAIHLLVREPLFCHSRSTDRDETGV